MRTLQASGISRCFKRHVCAIVPLVCIVITAVSLAAFLELVGLSQPVKASGETAIIQINGPLYPPGFFPAILTIHVDDYVTFINQASPPATFILSDVNKNFTSPAIASGKQWTTTLSNPGTYEYHDAASPPRMVGMIVVVANSISLLPTPAPQVEATALALIETGKTPSDNLAVPTPTPTAAIRPSSPTDSGSLSFLLFISGILIVLLFIILLLIRLLRRRRLRKQQSKDGGEHVDGTVQEQPQQSGSWFRWRRRKKSKKDDEDDDDEDNDD